jgi:hypothetical protein
MNNYQAEQLTAKWLKQNGMDEKSFTVIDLPFIQAQQVAFALMKYHAELLDDDQTEFVSSYLEDIKHKAKRKNLTATKAYRVLNIGTKINRQLFKANRKSR